MSKLEELINELCPDGVDYKELQEVFTLRNGYTPSKDNPEFWENGTVPWFRMEDIRQNGRILGDSIQHVTQRAVKGNLFPADSIILATSATIGEHALLTVTALANQRFTFLTRKEPYLNSLYMKYFYYHCDILDEWCKQNVTLGNFNSVDMGKLKKYKFPLPPLPVQHEIVRILDNFTLLTAELTAELTARKKQYEYFRNLLLNFNRQRKGFFQWMTLGELGAVCMCKRIMKAETSPDGDVPFFKIGTFGKEPDAYISQGKYDEYRKAYSFPKKGDILISAAGTIGRAVVYDGKPAYYQDSNIVWIDNDENKVLNKYLFYCYAMKPWSVSNGGTIARLYNENLSKAKIPVPPLKEQERIVSILDRFDTLCNDLTTGLPAEIEARRKQYEYYRDKLLTFREAKA